MTLILNILDCVDQSSPNNCCEFKTWALKTWSPYGPFADLDVDSCLLTVFLQNFFTPTKRMLCHFCLSRLSVSGGEELLQASRLCLVFLPQGWWIEFSLLPWTSVFKLDLATVTNIIPLFHTQLQAIFPAWRRFEFISKRVYNAYLTLWALTDVT